MNRLSVYLIQYIRRFIQPLLLSAACLYSMRLEAQEIKARVFLPRQQFTIGARVPVELQLQYPKDFKPWLPAKLSAPGGLEFQEKVTKDSSLKGNVISFTKTYYLLALDTGVFQIGGYLIGFVKLDGSNSFSITTDTARFIVVLANVDTIKDIKPIVGPVQLPQKEGWPWEFIAAGILAVTLLALLYFLIRSKPKGLPEPAPASSAKTPYMLAMEELEELEKQKPWQKGALKEYYVRISHITRSYISYIYEVNTLEQTTGQTIESMRQERMKMEHLKNLEQILQMSDLVKFARYTPNEMESEQILQHSKELIAGIETENNADRAASETAPEGEEFQGK